MNIWIVYDSKFGNNKRVAEALANRFKEGNNVHVHFAKKISPKKVFDAGVDVFLFGGPLRAGMISFTMKSWANKLARKLAKQQKMVKIAAVWGTHARNDPETPAKFSWDSSKLKWKALLDTFPAEKKLPEVIGFAVNPTTLKGPLDPGWEEIVDQFADRVKNL
jgi:menaquinone-dependent protoporphyrinogen IX oxidase